MQRRACYVSNIESGLGQSIPHVHQAGLSASSQFIDGAANGQLEIRASAWLSMTGSVNPLRRNVPVAAGANLGFDFLHVHSLRGH